jgi:hypothetical protein
VLFICSRNQWRSPTAEQVFAKWPEIEVMSAGLDSSAVEEPYIFIKGGQWMSKTTNPPSEKVGNSPDGDVAWMPATALSAGHQSGNIGSTPSDVLWIALKN